MVDARLFGIRGMRGIGAFDFNKRIETTLKEKHGAEEEGIHLPLEAWQALSMTNDIKMMHDLSDWKK
ncbi:MAG: hypothetical protein WBO06_14880 [Gammaproteobacteria bacterium]